MTTPNSSDVRQKNHASPAVLPPPLSVSALPSDLLASRLGRSGLCRGANDDRAFPDERRTPSEDAAYAQELCAGCPVQAECLEFALRTEKTGRYGAFGIWGGTTPTQRRAMIRARRQALAVAS